ASQGLLQPAQVQGKELPNTHLNPFRENGHLGREHATKASLPGAQPLTIEARISAQAFDDPAVSGINAIELLRKALRVGRHHRGTEVFLRREVVMYRRLANTHGLGKVG